jgi:D-glycero-D-manno-heptose 1,7-bisphosphate phosphatase
VKKPAAFIDRDGTINEQMGYINHLSRFKIIPGVPEAVRLLNDLVFW